MFRGKRNGFYYTTEHEININTLDIVIRDLLKIFENKIFDAFQNLLFCKIGKMPVSRANANRIQFSPM